MSFVADFAHMCVTVLANLTHSARKRRSDNENREAEASANEPIFLSLENEIIPYFNAQWENLTSMSRRYHIKRFGKKIEMSIR